MKRKEIIFYGIDSYMEIIEQIIKDLCLNGDAFDIRLILTEALTNAFKHGNNSDKSKPIKLTYYYDGNKVRFQIADCGLDGGNIVIPDEISDEEILNESGKGLFLIKALSNKFEIINNVQVIEKYIK